MELREGLLHPHLELIFNLHSRLSLSSCLYAREIFADKSVLDSFWQAILGPAEVLLDWP
jgi:hypothetical protein